MAPASMAAALISFGPFVFDPGQRLLTRDDVELLLPPRVLAVLEVLLSRAGELVPRQELMESVWKDAFVTDTSLAEAISLLRQALGDDPQAPAYIQTVHRRGYRFVAPTTSLDVTARTETNAASGHAKVSPSIAGHLMPWSLAAVFGVLAIAAVWKAVRAPEPPAPPLTRFAIATAPLTRFDDRAPALALSPDGSRAAWSACDEAACRLYIRASNELEPAALAGTEGAAAPFFAPDGRAVGFFANGHLKKVPISGGSPVTLADAADPLGAVWLDDEIIYAGAGAGLMVIADVGGEPAVLTTPRAAAGEVRHVWPASFSGSNIVLFTATTGPQTNADGRLALLRLDAPESPWTILLSGVARAAPIADDAFVFSSAGELQGIAFDKRTQSVSGAPYTFVRHLAMSRGAGQFAVSATGALLTVESDGAKPESSLVWWTAAPDRASSNPSKGAAAPSRDLENIALSPDGRRAAGVERVDASRTDIWISDLERGAASRLTHAGINAAPVWSANGSRVFFAASQGGTFGIHAADLDSPGSARLIFSAGEHAFPTSASPDGTLLALTSRAPGTGSDVWALPLDGSDAQPLIRTPFEDVAAVFSPDGRFLAYQSNDAGRWEVYLHRRADQRRIAVSTHGGTNPFWSADGRSLFFQSGSALMRAGIPARSEPGTPEVVARLTAEVPIAADRGRRILLQRRAQIRHNGAVMTIGWGREVKQILGPPAASLPR